MLVKVPALHLPSKTWEDEEGQLEGKEKIGCGELKHEGNG